MPSLSQLVLDVLRPFHNRIAQKLRLVVYRRLGMKFGHGVRIAPGVQIDDPQNLRIGNEVSIQHNCYLSAYGGLTIGDEVSIGHGCSIVSSSHCFEDAEIPIRRQPLIKASVEIKDNVWIGMKCSILAGVTIGGGSIVGANSLVNKDVPENSIVGGVPARVIRKRT